MKKPLLIFLCIGLCFCANGHNEKSRKSVQSDNSFDHVLYTIKDTTQSYLDIKPELFSLIDSMQLYVDFCPKGKVRFAAKSIAMTLSQLMLDTTLNSPEELNFFMDSVLPKLDNVLQTWYVEASAPNEELQWKTMVQYAIRLENSHNYVTEVDVHILPDIKRVALYFPHDAVANPSIMFGNDRWELDTISFHINDALDFVERTDSTNMAILFDETLLEAMLSHYVMFVGYINDHEETNEITERFSDCAILLYKFQEQYSELQKQ